MAEAECYTQPGAQLLESGRSGLRTSLTSVLLDDLIHFAGPQWPHLQNGDSRPAVPIPGRQW